MCAGGTSAGSEEQTSHSYGMPTSSSIYSRAGGGAEKATNGEGAAAVYMAGTAAHAAGHTVGEHPCAEMFHAMRTINPGSSGAATASAAATLAAS